jgi:hypothetical protein
VVCVVQVEYSAEEARVVLYDPQRSLLVKLDGAKSYWATVDPPGAQPEAWNSLAGGQWRDGRFTARH